MIESSNFLAREATEVLVGVIGIGLTLSVQLVAEWMRGRVLQKRFPVSGAYLTRYEDKGKVYSDMVRLTQSGRKIKGTSVPNVERDVSSRKWIFEGQILAEGYLQGTYKPEALTDKGFGAFFLRFEKNGDMSGYWTGKDADESRIVSGEYSFLRQPQFVVAMIENSDCAQVLRIAEDRLGDAYIDPADLTSSADTVAVCARVDGCVAAFATARMLDTKDFMQKVRTRLGPNSSSLLPLERRVTNEERIGFVASAATHPGFEGRGLGAELIGKCIDGLEERDANVMVSTAWKSDKGTQAGSILECRGFQRVLELERYWEIDSVAHGYSCPTCGKPPCLCSAVIYVRNRHAKKKAVR